MLFGYTSEEVVVFSIKRFDRSTIKTDNMMKGAKQPRCCLSVASAVAGSPERSLVGLVWWVGRLDDRVAVTCD